VQICCYVEHLETHQEQLLFSEWQVVGFAVLCPTRHLQGFRTLLILVENLVSRPVAQTMVNLLVLNALLMDQGFPWNSKKNLSTCMTRKYQWVSVFQVKWIVPSLLISFYGFTVFVDEVYCFCSFVERTNWTEIKLMYV
jgi:hypothetical protein